jgi:hypothetical protein
MKYLVPDSLTTAQAKPMSKESMDLNSKANAYQMTSQCLYWADGVSEILFVVPALSCTSPSFISCIAHHYFSFCWGTNCFVCSVCFIFLSAPFHEPSSLNDSPQNQLGKEQKNINFSKRLTKDSAYISEVRMLVVWCECYEDHTTIPIGKFSPSASLHLLLI